MSILLDPINRPTRRGDELSGINSMIFTLPAGNANKINYPAL